MKFTVSTLFALLPVIVVQALDVTVSIQTEVSRGTLRIFPNGDWGPPQVF